MPPELLEDDDGRTAAKEEYPLLSGRPDGSTSRPSLPNPSDEQDVSLWEEWSTQAKTAGPAILSMILYRLPWLISLRFVGDLGADELAAAALASTLCNVTGLSLSVGLSSALTTLAGQARGHLLRQRRQRHDEMEGIFMVKRLTTVSTVPDNPDDNDGDNDRKDRERNADAESGHAHSSGTNSFSTSWSTEEIAATSKPPMPLVFLVRGLFIQLLIVLPVGIWWLMGIEPLLLALGQGAQLSAMTQSYLRILTPGLWSYSINWTLTSWLQTMEMSDVPAYAAACGLLVHVPLNYLFIYGMGWGYLGCAVATVAFQIIQPVCMLVYLLSLSGNQRMWHQMGATKQNVTPFWYTLKLAVSRGFGQYLGLALPGIVIISEWWASEIAIFLSGRLDNPAVSLGAMTLYQSINSSCFMFPTGIAIAGAARVSTWLGAGRSTAAAKASALSVASAGCVSGILGAILYLTPHTFFPSLFAPTEVDLYTQAGQLMPLLALYVFADGVQNALNGTIKGCGKQALIMPVVVVAYWVVGLPLAYHWAFDEDCTRLCGDVGLVSGMLTGTWVHMLLLAALILFRTDWPSEAEKAHARMIAAQHED